MRTAGTPVTALTIDASGNLGLGVAPSASSNLTNIEMPQGVQIGARKLAGYPQLYLSSNVSGDAYGPTYKINGYATQYRLESYAGNHEWHTAPSGTAGNPISFTQAMTLDASGNLLLGTTSAVAQFSVYSSNVHLQLQNATTGTAASDGSRIYLNGSDLLLVNRESATMQFYTADTERARIDSSGNLLVGTSSGYSGERMIVAYNGSTQRGIVVKDTASQNSNPMAFLYGSTLVGYIGITSSSTSYNTSSDYRLKNTIAPMTGALAKVALLKPCTYKWNADGSDGEGFIAHELAEVCPHAVTGEKDAVDADGNPQYQGIDTSFLVATLTAAIQELKAEFDAYKASHP